MNQGECWTVPEGHSDTSEDCSRYVAAGQQEFPLVESLCTIGSTTYHDVTMISQTSWPLRDPAVFQFVFHQWKGPVSIAVISRPEQLQEASEYFRRLIDTLDVPNVCIHLHQGDWVSVMSPQGGVQIHTHKSPIHLF